jgi:hypothetical protein
MAQQRCRRWADDIGSDHPYSSKIKINKDGKIEIETLGTGPQKLRNVKKTK